MHLRVVLRDWLDVVVPALLFSSHAANPGCLLSISISNATSTSRLPKVLAHERAMVRLRQLHWINLRTEEWNL